MAKINLPNVRQQSTVRFNVSLKDNGVSVDWAGLSRITALIFSDSQKIVAGPCTAVVDPEDSKNLIVTYTADKSQYLGIASVCIRCVYHEREKTYDKKALNFVERTAQATGVTVLDDPVVDVQLEVSEVSTSLLDEAIDACIAATESANEAAANATSAAEHQPVIDPDSKHWLIWNAEDEEYQDTGVLAKGQKGDDGDDGITPHIDEDTGHWFIGSEDTGVTAQGPKGDSGDINYPTFEIDSNMHLKVSALTEGSAERFSIQNGHLIMTL